MGHIWQLLTYLVGPSDEILIPGTFQSVWRPLGQIHYTTLYVTSTAIHIGSAHISSNLCHSFPPRPRWWLWNYSCHCQAKMCKSERFICPSFLALGHQGCKKAHKAWKVNCSRIGSYSTLVSCHWVCKWRREKMERRWEIYRGRNESGLLTANWWSSGMACFQDAARHRFHHHLLLVTAWGRVIPLHRRYKQPGLKRIPIVCHKAP